MHYWTAPEDTWQEQYQTGLLTTTECARSAPLGMVLKRGLASCSHLERSLLLASTSNQKGRRSQAQLGKAVPTGYQQECDVSQRSCWNKSCFRDVSARRSHLPCGATSPTLNPVRQMSWWESYFSKSESHSCVSTGMTSEAMPVIWNVSFSCPCSKHDFEMRVFTAVRMTQNHRTHILESFLL